MTPVFFWGEEGDTTFICLKNADCSIENLNA